MKESVSPQALRKESAYLKEEVSTLLKRETSISREA